MSARKRKRQTWYILYISFPLNMKTVMADTEEVERIVGCGVDGSGIGLGQRDVDFSFASAAERAAAKARFMSSEFARRPGVEVSTHDNVDD